MSIMSWYSLQNDIKKTVILSTSPYGRAIPEPARVHLSAVKDKPDFKYFKQPNLPCGVLLEGKFVLHVEKDQGKRKRKRKSIKVQQR